ncbi:ScbR family autoregulator-binding transcription factor [Streptacidiphilus sp. EB129]|uniref:ScbR family autoregulator-binding transcription factor n=1 Tax=Streptacidiphilus sp. EB129 TaxID=3156262 RepID=UPI003513F1B8
MAQQERAVRTRQAILLAAASVFDERGYEAASITEVLSRCQMTKGALYFHFSSKEELARGVIEAQVSDLVIPDCPSKLQSLVDLTQLIAQRLRTDVLLRAGIRMTVEQGTFVGGMTGPYQEWINVCQDLLEKSKEAGELLPYTDPMEVAQLVVGAFTGFQLISQVYSGREDLPGRLSSFWRCLLPGIAVAGVLSHIDADRVPAAVEPLVPA